ncbi:MAG TPA: hypothetical protein VFO00_00420, partial [Vitreimonas sp.]|nr:hypothetical protein [Vitreimonas sp.]
MMRYQRPPRADEARLIDALRTLNLHERDLGDLEQARAAIERLPCPQRRWIEQELRRWRRASARLNAGALAALSLEQLLDAARHRLLLRPAYFIFAHDHAIDLATKQP